MSMFLILLFNDRHICSVKHDCAMTLISNACDEPCDCISGVCYADLDNIEGNYSSCQTFANRYPKLTLKTIVFKRFKFLQRMPSLSAISTCAVT